MVFKQCIVVFPAYKALSKLECDFFENGLLLTEGFTQVIIGPENLNIDQSFGALQNLKVIRFPNHFFGSIDGYNKLLLSVEFYTRFIEYEYLLIHQADAYLFKNELDLWCKKDFDYIGAPWYRPSKINKGLVFNIIYKNLWQPLLVKRRKNGWLYNKVGNGGLSLRKVKSALNILESSPKEILNDYLNKSSSSYNEDVFWSIEAPKINCEFRIPKYCEALHFSIEFEPKIAFEKINFQLPFGCHAPLLNDKIFWKDYIPVLKDI